MFVEYQPSTPSRRALKPGARIVFISVWPVLKSLPPIGTLFFFASSISAGVSTVRLGAPFAYGTPRLERRVGVDLRRRDLRIALGQPLLERGQRRVHGRRAAIDLGRSAPHHHQPIAAVVLLEALDVLDHLVGEIGLRLARLLVRRGELLDVFLIEHRRHRLDRRQEVLQRRQVLLRQHPGLGRRHERVVGEQIPAAEHDVVELRERNELTDERRARISPLAQPDRAHLGQRADRLGRAAPDRLDPGHEGGRDRAHAGGQDAELAGGRLDVRFCCGGHFGLLRVDALAPRSGERLVRGTLLTGSVSWAATLIP